MPVYHLLSGERVRFVSDEDLKRHVERLGFESEIIHPKRRRLTYKQNDAQPKTAIITSDCRPFIGISLRNDDSYNSRDFTYFMASQSDARPIAYDEIQTACSNALDTPDEVNRVLTKLYARVNSLRTPVISLRETLFPNSNCNFSFQTIGPVPRPRLDLQISWDIKYGDKVEISLQSETFGILRGKSFHSWQADPGVQWSLFVPHHPPQEQFAIGPKSTDKNEKRMFWARTRDILREVIGARPFCGVIMDSPETSRRGKRRMVLNAILGFGFRCQRTELGAELAAMETS